MDGVIGIGLSSDLDVPLNNGAAYPMQFHHTAFTAGITLPDGEHSRSRQTEVFSLQPGRSFLGMSSPRPFEQLLADDTVLPLPSSLLTTLPRSASGVVLGLRAHQLALAPGDTDACHLDARVDLAEISGSETFVHVSRAGGSLVAQVPGVHRLSIGEPRTLYFKAADLYCFDERGALLFSPRY